MNSLSNCYWIHLVSPARIGIHLVSPARQIYARTLREQSSILATWISPTFQKHPTSFIVILNIKSLRTPVPGPPHHIDHFISHLVNHHGSHLVLKNGPSSRQPRRSPCRPPCHFIHSHMCVLHICVLDGVKNVTDQWSNRRKRWFYEYDKFSVYCPSYFTPL